MAESAALVDQQRFECPACNRTVATLSGNNVSLCGNATIAASFPPADWHSNWLKCSDCNIFATLRAVESTGTNDVEPAVPATDNADERYPFVCHVVLTLSLLRICVCVWQHTSAAKEFAAQLVDDMARVQLTALMGEVEQLRNANQQKLGAGKDTELERSVEELSVIHKAVEQRLQQEEASSANKKTGNHCACL